MIESVLSRLRKASILNETVLSDVKETLGDDFAMLITNYLDKSSDYITEMRQAWSVQHFDKLAKAAHPLKSSSQQIGAEQLAQYAAVIEDAAWKKAPIDYQSIIAETSVVLMKTKQHLENWPHPINLRS